MPFASAYDAIYNELIEPAAAKASELLIVSGGQALKPYRTKDEMRTISGWINILERLYPAQIVLGVLTDNNANVFYELGIAHATQPITRQILIANKDYKALFDTKDLIFFPYENALNESVEPLANIIVDAIKWFKIEEDRTIIEAKKQVGVCELEVMMTQNCKHTFPLHTSHKGQKEYEEELLTRIGAEHTHLKGCFYRHVAAVRKLLDIGLLEFVSESENHSAGVNVKYTFRWTNLGNDLLFAMKLIPSEERQQRRQV